MHSYVSPFFVSSATLLYIIMDNKTKRECITQIENYYCQRLTELVDMKMFDEAHAIFEEFSVGDDDNHINGFLSDLKMMAQKLYLLKTN